MARFPALLIAGACSNGLFILFFPYRQIAIRICLVSDPAKRSSYLRLCPDVGRAYIETTCRHPFSIFEQADSSLLSDYDFLVRWEQRFNRMSS